jgi:Ca2+-binding RTX toxin-like protein
MATAKKKAFNPVADSDAALSHDAMPAQNGLDQGDGHGQKPDGVHTPIKPHDLTAHGESLEAAHDQGHEASHGTSHSDDHTQEHDGEEHGEEHGHDDDVQPPPLNVITGTEGNDFLNGTAGNDLIDALGGQDYVSAGAGDDTVIAGMGGDQLYGDAGNDTLVLSGVWSDYYFEFGSLNGINDVMTLLDLRDAGQLTTPGTDGWDMFAGFEVIKFANETLTMDQFLARGNETIVGTDGNDRIRAGFGDDTVYGGLGDDQIFAGSGNNIVYGGDGNDLITTDQGTSFITGGGGDDTIMATEAGATFVYSGNQSDYVLTAIDAATWFLEDQRANGDGKDTIAGPVATPPMLQFADGTISLAAFAAAHNGIIV